MSTPITRGLSTVLSTAPKTASLSSASAAHISSPAATSSRRVPLDKRKRTETSCDKCKSRKQKCRKEPGQDACRYCILHNIQCLTTQPRKKRLYGSVEGLSDRLALLESLVKGLLPEADVSSLDEMRQLGTSLGIPLPDPANGLPNDSDQENSAGTAPGLNQGAEAAGPDKDGPLSFKLLPDQQGQVQYIGPSSSFSFHLNLRSLCGQGARREFVLFGRNPADVSVGLGEDDGDPHSFSSPTSAPASTTNNSPAHAGVGGATAPGVVSAFDSLIGAYFAHINPDFPVLHEASFRVAYDEWFADKSNADPAWLCSFLCMLLLARRVTRVTIPEEEEKRWWRRIQTLLPVVIFTTSVVAVQALLLAAIHLHNTNHRDACWNLTGTAVRIAFAIGLHQENVNSAQTPLTRELRRRLWWTLYAFEQMQVSSYDRPSAIDQFGFKVKCPNTQILASTQYYPPDYRKWFNRMVVHLSSTCRAPKSIKSSATEELYAGPLSPAFGVKRDLERWQTNLPQHLHMEALETSPPAFHRPILLLHALYHYTVIVLCRAALLERATLLSRERLDSPNAALIEMADSCSHSGKTLARILLKLDTIRKLDLIFWWDSFYALSSGSVLVLDIVCVQYLGLLSGDAASISNGEVPESRILLTQLADLAHKSKRNPHIPGTIEKFISIVPELHAMADSATQNMILSMASTTATTTATTDVPTIFTSTTPSSTSLLEPHLQGQPRQLAQNPHQQHHPLPHHGQPSPSQMAHHDQQQQHATTLPLPPYLFGQSTTNSGAFMLADTSASQPSHPHAQQQQQHHHHNPNAHLPMTSSARFFSNTSPHHPDFSHHGSDVLGPPQHAPHHHQTPNPFQPQQQHPIHPPPPPQQQPQQQQNPPHTSAAAATPRFDRNLQMGFMDFTVNQIQDWNWADLGSLLASGGAVTAPPPGGGTGGGGPPGSGGGEGVREGGEDGGGGGRR